MALKPKQIELIEALLANPMVSDTAIAEQIGINRNTVHNWKIKPEFQEEFRKRMREKWEDSERMAVESMLSLVREGNFQATKYILDNLGYAPVQKQQIDANVNNNIILNIDEEE